MDTTPRVLSIQSHVVSGYVGNKCATFPLQLLGFEVDAINSVQFSNRVGHKTCTGQTLTSEDLKNLGDGLKENNLDCYTHLLTGFIKSESFLQEIAELAKHLRRVNPKLVYGCYLLQLAFLKLTSLVCDPVMGDSGRMYVPETLLPIYQNLIVPLADIVTPNQFEIELLTGIKIDQIDDAWKAIEIIHRRGCRIVVVSSLELDEKNDSLLTLASDQISGEKLQVKIAKLPATFAGSGDLFTALVLGWLHKTNSLKESIERSLSSLQAVLKRTLQEGRPSRIMELKLIQSKNDIENAEIVVRGEYV